MFSKTAFMYAQCMCIDCVSVPITLPYFLSSFSVYNASTAEVPPHPSHNTVSPVEIEILSNCAIQWKDLAAGLGLAEVRVREIEQFPCTSNRERRRKVLQTFSAESGTRDRVTEVLDKMKWKAAANSLSCGYTNRYSTHSLL